MAWRTSDDSDAGFPRDFHAVRERVRTFRQRQARPGLVVQTREARGFDRLQVLRICAERHQRQTESATDLEDGRVALDGVGPVPVPVERPLQRLRRLLLRIQFPHDEVVEGRLVLGAHRLQTHGQRRALVPLGRRLRVFGQSKRRDNARRDLRVRREVAVLAQPHRARVDEAPDDGLRRRRDQHLRPHLVGAREAEVAELHGDVEHARVDRRLHWLQRRRLGARGDRRGDGRGGSAREGPPARQAQRVSSVDDERQRETLHDLNNRRP